MILRDASPADEAAWRGLWAGFLAYYGVTLAPEVTDFTWARLMDPSNALKARAGLGACQLGATLRPLKLPAVTSVFNF